MTRFQHDKLDVYHAAIDFFALANQVISELPAGRDQLADQLSTAALSVSANIAEGARELRSEAKARFYRVACRSATKCVAILDGCKRIDVVSERHHTVGRELLLRIVVKLSELAEPHDTL